MRGIQPHRIAKQIPVIERDAGNQFLSPQRIRQGDLQQLPRFAAVRGAGDHRSVRAVVLVVGIIADKGDLVGSKSHADHMISAIVVPGTADIPRFPAVSGGGHVLAAASQNRIPQMSGSPPEIAKFGIIEADILAHPTGFPRVFVPIGGYPIVEDLIGDPSHIGAVFLRIQIDPRGGFIRHVAHKGALGGDFLRLYEIDSRKVGLIAFAEDTEIHGEFQDISLTQIHAEADDSLFVHRGGIENRTDLLISGIGPNGFYGIGGKFRFRGGEKFVWILTVSVGIQYIGNHFPNGFFHRGVSAEESVIVKIPQEDAPVIILGRAGQIEGDPGLQLPTVGFVIGDYIRIAVCIITHRGVILTVHRLGIALRPLGNILGKQAIHIPACIEFSGRSLANQQAVARGLAVHFRRVAIRIIVIRQTVGKIGPRIGFRIPCRMGGIGRKEHAGSELPFHIVTLIHYVKLAAPKDGGDHALDILFLQGNGCAGLIGVKGMLIHKGNDIRH